MSTIIKDNATPSELLLKALSQHLPYSLPTLRRLQVMKTGPQTSDSHVLSTFDKESLEIDFLVAFLDFSQGPQTEMWMYSSIENPATPCNEALCEDQVLKLLERVAEIEREYKAKRETPGILLIGTLYDRIFQLLEKHSMVKMKTQQHFKFIFKVQDLPAGRQLPDGFSWSSIRASDIPLVLSRTVIPYKELVNFLSNSW